MCSEVQSWSNIPPQLFGVLQYQWEHLPHPVPRTLGRTGQTGLFRGQDVKTKCAGASCPLKNWQKIVPWSTSALRCSVVAAFSGQKRFCSLWLSIPTRKSIEKPSYDAHRLPSPITGVTLPLLSAATSSHPLWVTELGSQIYGEARCSLCSSLHRVDGSSEKSATAKAVYFQTLNSCFLQLIRVQTGKTENCSPDGRTPSARSGGWFILFTQGKTKASFRPFSHCYIDFWVFIQFEKIWAFTQTLTSTEITMLCALWYTLPRKVGFFSCIVLFS